MKLSKVEELTAEDQELLKNRCELQQISSETTICLHHKKVFLDLYVSLQKKCCNPFDLHTSTCKGSLRPLSLAQAQKINSVQGQNHIHAGMKVCPKCRVHLSSMETCSSSETEGVSTQDGYIPEDVAGSKLDEHFTAVGLTPIKAKKLKTQERASYAKRKLKQMHKQSKELVSASLNVPVSSISSPLKEIHSCPAESDLDHLLGELKKKLAGASKAQKISLLTLSPESWSIAKTAREFGVTEYIVRRSRQLKNEQGILPDIVHAKGKPLKPQTVKDVEAFYNEDDVSRMMPGSKDYKVSLKKGGEFTSSEDCF